MPRARGGWRLDAPLRTDAQRDALAAYVIRKLHSTWNTRKLPGGRGVLRYQQVDQWHQYLAAVRRTVDQLRKEIVRR